MDSNFENENYLLLIVHKVNFIKSQLQSSRTNFTSLKKCVFKFILIYYLI